MKSEFLRGFRGIDNVGRPEDVRPEFLQTARNVMLDDLGGIALRPGSTLAYASSSCTAVMAAGADLLFLEGSDLKRLEPDGSATTVRSGLAAGRQLANLWLNDRLYFSDGINTGVYQNGSPRTWGMTPPPKPSIAPTSGGLIPGRYSVALVYVRRDGQESGASEMAVADCPDGGFVITGIAASADPDVDAIGVYVSSADGEQLWAQTMLANADTSLTLTGGPVAKSFELATQNMAAPPPCSIIEHYKGRLVLACGTDLVFTENFWRYELVSRDRNRYPLPAEITAIVALQDGAWVGTRESLAFFSGHPEDEGGFQIRSEMKKKVLRGAVSVDGDMLSVRGLAPGRVALIPTTDGIMACDGVGMIMNLTGDHWVPPGDSGMAGIIWNLNGRAQYMLGVESSGGYGSGRIAVEV